MRCKILYLGPSSRGVQVRFDTVFPLRFVRSQTRGLDSCHTLSFLLFGPTNYSLRELILAGFLLAYLQFLHLYTCFFPPPNSINNHKDIEKSWIRTSDYPGMSRGLYQLSYTPDTGEWGIRTPGTFPCSGLANRCHTTRRTLHGRGGLPRQLSPNLTVNQRGGQ